MSPLRPDHERIPRPDRPPKPPDGWVSLDPEVERARESTCGLHTDHRAAQEAARAADEALTQAERDAQTRRARAFASGEPDPGDDAATVAKAEQASEKARKTADAMAEAVAESHRQLEATIVERSDAWQEAARKALDRAGVELRAGIETVAEAFGAWREAHAQLVLADDERARRKGALRGDTTLRLPENPSVVDALAAMVAMTEPAHAQEERDEAPVVV